MSYNYGLWLYKEVATSYGLAKIEIYDANYTGNPIEIDALSANSIILSVSNLSSISSPVQKSQLSFSIIDTQQFDYSVFFTPDARRYKVVLKTQIKGESYVTRWSGYLTPDSYIEELQYRSTIDLIARDNIGLLNDYTFDYVPTDISNNVESVRNIILGAFAKIDDTYPMEILFRTEKCSVGNDVQESILVIDSMVNCYQMYDKTWGEVIEILLHDLGLQLRFIDNNRIAIYDLSQINNLNGDGANKSIRFLEGSGIREIMPAWREVNIEQDYGIIDDFYIGEIDSEDKLEYVKASSFNRNISLYEPAEITHWKRENDIYLLNFLNILNNYVDDNKINSLYITGAKASVSDADILTNRLIYTQKINPIDKQITISFRLNDTLREPNDTVYSRGDGNPYVYLPYGTIGRTRTPLVYQIKYRFNIFLIGDDGNTYIMRDKWVNANSELEDNFIEFTTKKLQIYATNNISEDGANRMRFTQYNNEEEYSIVINTIPVAGKLQFVIYPYTFLEDSYADIRDVNTFERGAKISDIKFSVETESKGLESTVSINPNHNIKGKESFIYGEVPAGQGDFLLYTGGLFYPGSLETINGFKLPNRGNGSTYHLLELVNREIIHYSKKNYNLLSGSLDYEDNIPLMFNHILLREGKTFLIKDASLNIIQNIINITSAQEVEDYADGSFAQINSPVSSGSVNLGGGGNIAMQFSSDAGNAKRIYELDTATDEELSGAYIILDKAGLSSAKKYSLQSIADTLDWFELRTLESGTKILFTKYTLVSALDQIAGGVGEGGSSSSGAAYNRLDTWENYNEDAGDVLSAKLGYDLKQQIEQLQQSGGSGESVVANITVKIGDAEYTAVDGVVSLPAYPTVPTVPTKLSELIDDLVAGNYLPLTGGILSGALSAPSINITSAAAAAHLAFGRQGGNIITAPSGGYFIFIPGGKSIATANADLVITDGIVYPGTTGVTKLGFGDKRWSQVSSVDGDFSGALTAGTFSTANVVSCGGRLRINASNSVNSFGFLKATAYTASLNRAVLDIGSNYGGSSDITSEAVDVVAMSMYRGAVGVGRAFTYEELYANKASNIMLSVEGNINNVGDIVSTGEQVAGSDMRYKIVKSKFRLSSAIIAHAPLFRFKWKNHKTTKLKIGTSAQYWEEFAPELVTYDSVSDFKHLNYAGLGVAIGISNAREIEQLKKEIVSLKEKLSKYEHN